MSREIVNMGHSARTRLTMLAKEHGRDASYLFQRYAFERFYYRLGKSQYADKFILKGAALFAVWMGPMFRVTQDADLESMLTPDHEQMRNIFAEIAQMKNERDDGVVYDVSSIEVADIKAQDEYKGLRIKFNAHIEQARIRLQFDIGFGDSVYPRARFTEYPVLIGGEAPCIKIYPEYTVVAEKVSAMILLGMNNSRLKDYFDIWVLTQKFEFDFSVLKTAVCRTFKRKGVVLSDEWPLGLSKRFAGNPIKISQWNAFIRKIEPCISPKSLEHAVERIRDFLHPVIFNDDDTSVMKWYPSVGRWADDIK